VTSRTVGGADPGEQLGGELVGLGGRGEARWPAWLMSASPLIGAGIFWQGIVDDVTVPPLPTVLDEVQAGWPARTPTV
jgi:hypothetical protein